MLNIHCILIYSAMTDNEINEQWLTSEKITFIDMLFSCLHRVYM